MLESMSTVTDLQGYMYTDQRTIHIHLFFICEGDLHMLLKMVRTRTGNFASNLEHSLEIS